MSGNSDITAKPQIPFSLIGIVLCIGALGVSNIYSAARTTYPDLWMSQCAFLGVGVVVSMVGLFLDYHSIEQVAYPFYGLIVFLLMLVPIVGRKVLGAKRWLNFGFGNFQPSELMKIAIIFILARFFAEERRDEGYTIRDLIRPLNISRPLAAIAALIYLWKKNPWLTDPVGELARKIALVTNGRIPEWEESYFFRMFALTAIAAYLAIGGYLHARVSRGQNPFDERANARSRFRLVVWLGPPMVALLLCFVFWQAEFVGDPSAVIIGWLVNQGSAGGALAEFQMHYWFRALLVVGLLVYLIAAIYRQLTLGRPDLSNILAPIDLVVIPMGLIGIEPDLGTALLVGAVAFSVILFVGMRYASVIIMAASGVVLA